MSSHLSDHCLFFSFAILCFYIPKSFSCTPSWVTAWTHVHVPSVSEYINRMCNLRDGNVVWALASVQQHCTLFPCKVLSVLVYVYFIVGNRLWILRSGEFQSAMRDYLKKKKQKHIDCRDCFLHCNDITIRVWMNFNR